MDLGSPLHSERNSEKFLPSSSDFSHGIYLIIGVIVGRIPVLQSLLLASQ